jgi:hypothetical protein
MQWSDIEWQPPSRKLRQFAGLWLAFFGALAVWCWVADHRQVAILLGILALGLGGTGLAAPGAIRLVYVGWMVLAFPLGWTLSHVLLAIVYYGVFTPIGIIFRVIGRDALHLRRRDCASYWVARPEPESVRRYFEQF